MPHFTRSAAPHALRATAEGSGGQRCRPTKAARGTCPAVLEGAPPRSHAAELASEALDHVDALYGFALRLSHDRHLAEDLVQETFARGLAGSHGFVPGTQLKAWLFRILRNAFLDLRRREARSPLRAVSEVPQD